MRDPGNLRPGITTKGITEFPPQNQTHRQGGFHDEGDGSVGMRSKGEEKRDK